MSISSEINRIAQNVSDSLTAVAAKGVTVPSGATSDDLPTLIASIQTGGGTPAISVVDTTDSHGGTVREITALDISDTTAVASDVTQGKYFYTAQGVKTAGTGSGGTPSATQHSIYFEFSDNTNTTINAWYDDSFISNAITATTPTTYGQKTVTLAQLDGVTWYEYGETWETIYDSVTSMYVDGNDRYFWIASLANVTIPLHSSWRITLDSTVYSLFGKSHYVDGLGNTVVLGNPKWLGYEDDNTGVPFCFYNYNSQSWCGDTELPAGDYSIKIERLVTS